MRRAALSLALLLIVTPAFALSDAPYISGKDLDPVLLLPSPPALGSKAQASDMAAVLAAQKSRTKAQAAKAEVDAPLAISQFTEVLGPAFNKDNLPKLNAFLVKVSREANTYTNTVKDFWKRPRPFETNPAVHPPGGMKATTLDLQGQPTVSFPSGNAAFGAEMAVILADMVPEKRAELFARGWELGTDRIVGGVHYPTDVQAGRLIGTVMVSLMMQNPAFRADLAEAKAELRAALKLPP